MFRILRSYALRETLVPTILAAVTLAFFILIRAKAPWNDEERLLFTLIKFLFRDDVDRRDTLRLFLFIMPGFLMFIAPMAVLVGMVVGVGRMTLDLEIRAMQASGANLLSVFAPVLLVAAGFSALHARLGWDVQPRMLGEAVKIGAKLFITEFTNLDPGRVHENIPREDSGVFLHYAGRDPVTREMRDTTVLLERSALDDEEERDQREWRVDHKRDKLKALYDAGVMDRETYERLDHELRLSKRPDPPMLVFADRARLSVSPETREISLELHDGSIHLLEEDRVGRRRPGGEAPAPGTVLAEDGATSDSTAALPSEDADPGASAPSDLTAIASSPLREARDDRPVERDYAVIRFGTMRRVERIEGDVEFSRTQTRTIPELIAMRDDASVKKWDRREAASVILYRLSASLECLVYALIGLPLAIWIRPTGKSIGIVLAAGVVLVYHFLLQVGYSMVEDQHPLGTLMIFSPNLLLGAVGAGLWRRALRG